MRRWATLTLAERRRARPCRIQTDQAKVFAGLYPVESNQYEACVKRY